MATQMLPEPLSKLLTDLEMQHEQLLQNCTYGFFILKDERFVFVNESFRCLLRAPSAQALIGETIWDFVGEAYRNALKRYMEASDGTTPEWQSFDLMTYEKKEVMEVEVAIARSSYYRKSCVTGVVRCPYVQEHGRDLHCRLDEMEKIIDQLTVCNEQLEEFALSTSHDLQEPLFVISNTAAMLEQMCEARLKPNERRCLEMIKETALEARQLVKEFLDMSKTVPPLRNPDLVDVSELLHDLVVKLKPALDSASGKVTYGHLPKLRTSRIFLIYVFKNLLTNAIKYRGTEALEVQIQCVREGAKWLFSVQDNGKGICNAKKETIFQAGVRASSDVSGSGMGLHITRKVLKCCGGDIWVHSEEGRGSTFYFFIPA